MRAGSLFSGIGGLDAGLARAGLEHAFLCESDEWRRGVLRERLQALPDGWTDLPWNGKPHSPDSRRYAGLGDAVTASVGEWIGRRLLMESA